MFRGQTHVIAFRSSSTLNDSISFDFTGATLPLAHQRPIYVTHTPAALSSTRMPLSLTCLRAGLPVSSSIATVHHLSPTEWGVSATWPLCNSDLGTVRHSPYSSPLTPPPLTPSPPPPPSPYPLLTLRHHPLIIPLLAISLRHSPQCQRPPVWTTPFWLTLKPCGGCACLRTMIHHSPPHTPLQTHRRHQRQHHHHHHHHQYQQQQQHRQNAGSKGGHGVKRGRGR